MAWALSTGFLILMLMLISGLLACSPGEPSSPSYTMEDTFDMAPAVIYGTHKGQTTDPNTHRSNDTIEVHCIFKSGGFKINQYIFLDNIIEHFGPCVATSFREGNEYLIAIKETQIPDETDDNYAIYIPAISHVAAFPPTEENIKKVVLMCGLDDMVTDPEGVMNMYMCPMRKVTRGNCTQPATVPPTTSPLPSKSNVLHYSYLLVAILSFSISWIY